MLFSCLFLHVVLWILVSSLLSQRFVYGKGQAASYVGSVDYVWWVTKVMGIGGYQADANADD